MTPHFPSLKPKELIRLLLAKGFVERRVTGSHHIFKHPQNGRTVTVPIHGNKEIKPGTLRNILKQADIDPADLIH